MSERIIILLVTTDWPANLQLVVEAENMGDKWMVEVKEFGKCGVEMKQRVLKLKQTLGVEMIGSVQIEADAKLEYGAHLEENRHG